MAPPFSEDRSAGGPTCTSHEKKRKVSELRKVSYIGTNLGPLVNGEDCSIGKTGCSDNDVDVCLDADADGSEGDSDIVILSESQGTAPGGIDHRKRQRTDDHVGVEARRVSIHHDQHGPGVVAASTIPDAPVAPSLVMGIQLADSTNDDTLTCDPTSTNTTLQVKHTITPLNSVSDLQSQALLEQRRHLRRASAQSTNVTSLVRTAKMTMATTKAPAETTATTPSHGTQQNSPFNRRTTATTTTPRSPISTMIAAIVFVTMFCVYQYHCFTHQANNAAILPNSVYVSGGGFSGFWFILGQLNSIDAHEHQLVCYSAGCLASVVALMGWNVNQTTDLAFDVQQKWSSGELERTQVVTEFVDQLLEEFDSDAPEWLSNLHIITAAKDGWWGMKTVLHTVSSMPELRTRLLQTTWIPLATGDGLWMQEEMDGVFHIFHHPACTQSVRLAPDWSIYSNMLNPNLSLEYVHELARYGEAYGL